MTSPMRAPQRALSTCMRMNQGIQSSTKASATYANPPFYDIKADHKKETFVGNDGHRPTSLQKTGLVMTRMFPTKGDIPNMVSSEAMNRMRRRMRMMIILGSAAAIYGVIYASGNNFSSNSNKIDVEKAAKMQARAL